MKRTSMHRNTRPRLTCRVELERCSPVEFSLSEWMRKRLQYLRYGKTPSHFKYSSRQLSIQHFISGRNKKLANTAKDCGCFRCLAHFKVDEIDWLSGGAAFCPNCNIDAVIIETEHDKVDDVLLKEMQAWYFESTQS